MRGKFTQKKEGGRTKSCTGVGRNQKSWLEPRRGGVKKLTRKRRHVKASKEKKGRDI